MSGKTTEENGGSLDFAEALVAAQDLREAAERRADEAEAACAVLRASLGRIRSMTASHTAPESCSHFAVFGAISAAASGAIVSDAGSQRLEDERALVEALRQCAGASSIYAMKTVDCRDMVRLLRLRANEALATPFARRLLAGEEEP